MKRRRALDLVLIALTSPVWIPTMTAIALGVAVTSGRPVFFRQERIGYNGEIFVMLKFRSMRNGKNPLIPDPTRITRIGSVLRRTSLDELPQLLNVIRGDMSLVGPRPILPEQLTFMTQQQLQRHRVLPGLTGLAQVNGRNSVSWDERFDYDLTWARHPSISRYLTIVFRTFATVATASGIGGHDPNDRLLIDLNEPHATKGHHDQASR